MQARTAAGVCRTEPVSKHICDAQIDLGAGGTNVEDYRKFCKGKLSGTAQLYSLVRTDVFRHNRARRKDCMPRPQELFRIVNEETAKFLAEHRFVLPDLAAVAAESV